MDRAERRHLLLISEKEKSDRIFRKALLDIPGNGYELSWVSSVDEAVATIYRLSFDFCILCNPLGPLHGLDLFHIVKNSLHGIPVIFVMQEENIDLAVRAIAAGAASCLYMNELTASRLHHAIRIATERFKVIQALRASENKRRLLTRKLVEAQERERERIARELHDGIGSNLTAVKYALEDVRLRSEMDKPEGEGFTLEQVISIVKESMDDVHRISSDLRPSVLDDMGIISALKWTCKKMIENAPGISVTTRIEVEEEDVPSKLKIGVYRIVQEALNNVVRHSGADRVELFLGTDDNRLVLQIRDNGRGFDPDAVQRDASEESMGLESMQERVEITGGRCVIDSEKTAGTTIRASWTMP